MNDGNATIFSSFKILLRLPSPYTIVVVRMKHWPLLPNNFPSLILRICIIHPTTLLSITFPIILKGVVNPYEMFGRDNVAAIFVSVSWNKIHPI